MAETTKDKQPEVPQTAPSGALPPKLEGAVEMDDLTLRPASQQKSPETAIEASSSSDPIQPPVGGQESSPAAQSSSQNTSGSATAAEGEEPTSSTTATTEAKGKAPAAATPTPPAGENPLSLGMPSEESAAKGDMVVEIMLISSSSSSRHPFKITEKYLTKRNVNVPGVTIDGKMDPLSITVYSLKELILREWRHEWEPAPREPASIRLIRLGKMLDDKTTLRGYGFSGGEVPNVVHMTVKPQEMVEEEGGAAKGPKEAGNDNNNAACCCIVL